MIALDYRQGPWQEALDGVECDALITDPPFSARTHTGHNGIIPEGGDLNESRRQLDYEHFTPADVQAFVEHWHPRVRGWMAILTVHNLIPAWEAAFRSVGRYAFAPVPCVIWGMTHRKRGDGPSSWAVYLCVARPRTEAMAAWGTLPGAYAVNRSGVKGHIGGKPLALMRLIVRDYSRPGQRVCDPFAGGATTLLAAHDLGRESIGAEISPEAWQQGQDRIIRHTRQGIITGVF